MNKKLIGYLIFFVVLTAGFLFFVFRGNDNWKAKPITLSTVKPFNFSTQDGKNFNEQDLLGKVSVIEYFFTTCKGICPRMNSNMQTVYEKYKNEPQFQIVAHTSDPDRDSVPRLKQYADSMKLNTKNWILLTGSKQDLYNAARNSYLLDDPKHSVEKIEDQFIHTQFFALVDKNGQVRGQIYDGLKKDEISKLKKDIAVLLKEKQGTSKFANGMFNNNP